MNEPRAPGFGQGHPSPPHPPPQHATPAAHHPAPPHPAPPHPPHAPHQPPTRPGIAAGVVPAMTHAPTAEELEPISLIEEPAVTTGPAAPAPKKIMAFGADAHVRKGDYKRVANVTGHGACRVRSFHGKYSEQGLEYLDNAINEWLDARPEIEVKFVTSTVMTFEGKIREPALVLNLWY